MSESKKRKGNVMYVEALERTSLAAQEESTKQELKTMASQSGLEPELDEETLNLARKLKALKDAVI